MTDTDPEHAVSPRDRIGTLIFLCVLIAVALGAILLTRGFPTNTLATDVGPARFPVVYGLVLIALCLGAAVQTLRAPVGAALPPVPGAVLRVALAVASVALAIAAMPVLGFLVTATLFLYASIWLMGRRQIIGNAIYAIVASGAIYLLFYYGLNVPLPGPALGAG